MEAVTIKAEAEAVVQGQMLPYWLVGEIKMVELVPMEEVMAEMDVKVR